MEVDYTCAQCHGEFTSDWSDEDAEVEAVKNFGHIPDHDRAVVCDDCFQAMTAVVPLASTIEREARETILRIEGHTEESAKQHRDSLSEFDRMIYDEWMGTWTRITVNSLLYGEAEAMRMEEERRHTRLAQ